ncbi:MAG: DUF6055 domain-containing protein [bacterium]
MTSLSAIVLLATLTVGGDPSGPATTITDRNVLQEIEARYQRGDIDLDRYHYLRVAAVRRPARLPADLQLLIDRPLARSTTSVLVEGFQHVIRTGDYGGPIHELLQPPADLAYSIESTQWPIRVSYASTGQASYAQTVLAAAELSYNVQISDFGFYQPVIEPGYSPYRFYIEDAGQGVAGYTSPYDTNPGTSYTTCFTYIVIGPNLPGGPSSTVAHEISHSMQASMDCLEPTAFWEHTATYIEGITNPAWFAETLWFVPYFQAAPWRPLDYFASGAGYPYGGMLWLYYLVDTFAPTEGGVLVRELWEASMQSDWNVNEPDFYDAVGTVLSARGFESGDLDSVYPDFAEARYFVSSNDDGAHMAGASDFVDAEPMVSERHWVGELPVVEQQPVTAELPAPYGTSYVAVDLEPDSTRPLTFGFDGNGDTRWAVRVLLRGDGMPTVSQTMNLDPDTWFGSTVVDPTGYDEALLVVVNLGDADYDPDPDSRAWTPSGYYYSIEPILDPPVVTAVLPGAVFRGQQALQMRLVGENFVYSADFDIQFDDPLLEVVSIDSVRPTEVLFTMTVPGTAELGINDVTVVNGGGYVVTGAEVLAVVDELDSTDPGPKPSGCRTGGAPTPLMLLVVSLFLLGIRRRLRR